MLGFLVGQVMKRSGGRAEPQRVQELVREALAADRCPRRDPHRAASRPGPVRFAMIQFFHVSKRYPGGQAALDDVSFEIARGEFCFLTGASGAGKTTLLRLIFREEIPSEGQILVNGRNVASIPRARSPICGARSASSSRTSA